LRRESEENAKTRQRNEREANESEVDTNGKRRQTKENEANGSESPSIAS
jgi:hypothetical protein